MRLASINMRKGTNNPKRLSALLQWLSEVEPEILFVQEPATRGATLPTSLHRLHLTTGDAQIACWSRPEAILSFAASSIPALMLETSSVVICGTYLSANSSTTRIRQLQELHHLLREQTKPIVLLGDFNLAPSPEDGRFGDEASNWTKAGERKALGDLANKIRLLDLTSKTRLGDQHFTFERVINAKWSRFRCDLVFASDASSCTARYDHDVRLGAHAFTDHSACVVDFGNK